MTSEGSASGRFTRALQQRSLFAAEIAMRKMRGVSLALDNLALLADVRPDRFEGAALRWHGRLELEARTLSFAESQLALAALGRLRMGDKAAVAVLKQILRRTRSTAVTTPWA